MLLASSLSGDDGQRYLAEATNLWTHGTFSTDAVSPPAPTAHDMPLFPLLMAGLMAVVPDPLLAVKGAALCNGLLFGVAAVGVYTLGWRLTGRHAVGTLAMAVFGAFPESFPYAVFYMPESLFLALYVWGLVAFVQYARTRRVQPLLWTFVLWGLSVLAKPISLFIGPLLAFMAIAHACYERRSLIRRVSTITAGFLAGSAVIAPWVVRNYLAFGIIGISSAVGHNLFSVNYSSMAACGPGMRAAMAAREAEVDAAFPKATANSMARAAMKAAVARREILANLPCYATMTLKRHPALYVGTGSAATLRMLGDVEGARAMQATRADWRAWRHVPAHGIVLQIGSWSLLGLAYVLAVVGVVRVSRCRDWLSLAVILFGVLYFAIVIGPNVTTRYRVVMLPAFSIAAAMGLLGTGRGHAEDLHSA